MRDHIETHMLHRNITSCIIILIIIINYCAILNQIIMTLECLVSNPEGRTRKNESRKDETCLQFKMN